MKVRLFIAITASICISASAFAADEGETLFKNSGCGSCHSLANKGVGPSLKDIAAKYAGDKKAQAMLEKKVRSGGSGSFPSMPMPMPHSSVSQRCKYQIHGDLDLGPEIGLISRYTKWPTVSRLFLNPQVPRSDPQDLISRYEMPIDY